MNPGSDVPTINHLLYCCRIAYEFAHGDYGNRRTKRDFPGAESKRKGSISKLMSRIRGARPDQYWNWHGPARKMIVASYDQGLVDEYLKREKQSDGT